MWLPHMHLPNLIASKGMVPSLDNQLTMLLSPIFQYCYRQKFEIAMPEDIMHAGIRPTILDFLTSVRWRRPSNSECVPCKGRHARIAYEMKLWMDDEQSVSTRNLHTHTHIYVSIS